MKIDTSQVSVYGLTLEEDADPSAWDIDTGVIKSSGPIHIRAEVSKITNAVTVGLDISGVLYASCARCLNNFEIRINKSCKLNYMVDKREPVIDPGPDIREEILLDYPIKPLCGSGCKGLCPHCGKNLNEGGCSCAVT